jgi:hypothetical protein
MYRWRKSSRSDAADNGNCVEIAFAEQVAVRDSKNPTGPVLTFPVERFKAFLEGSRLGQ